MIYSEDTKNPKIIKILILATIILVISILFSKTYDIYQVHKMNQLTQIIYNHPLKVSNEAQSVKINLYKMHRNMKDIILYPSLNEVNNLIKKNDEIEKDIYKSLNIIEKNILGEEGKKLEVFTKALFKKSKPIREKVIKLAIKGKYKEAIEITKNEGDKHVTELENASENLYLYAQNKAIYFKNESTNIFKKFEKFNLYATFIFLSIFLFLSYYIINKISKDVDILENNKLLLETVIREAPNPIMIHNEKGKVLMINQVWEELCEYKYEEIDTIEKWTEKVYGKKASIVKSYIEKLFEKKQRVDEGEFIIISKSGKKLIWNFSSTSLGVINNQKTIITSAMDVTKLKEKDHILHIQSRHAAMGEMLSNISHQWRQPLSVISTIATGSSITYSVGNFDEKEFQSNMKQINSTVQYLSRTINDFSNFFNPNKEKKNFNMEELFKKTFTLISSQFHNKHINIIKNIEDIKIYGFENELIQVIINILNNAKDSLEINNIKEKYVFIDVYTKGEELVISIKDNAKGIKKDIIDKIFEPYFTTKHQSQGTGIGLYMSQEIIEKHMNGKIEVSNETFTHNNINYTGAQFKIYLQKK